MSRWAAPKHKESKNKSNKKINNVLSELWWALQFLWAPLPLVRSSKASLRIVKRKRWDSRDRGKRKNPAQDPIVFQALCRSAYFIHNRNYKPYRNSEKCIYCRISGYNWLRFHLLCCIRFFIMPPLSRNPGIHVYLAPFKYGYRCIKERNYKGLVLFATFISALAFLFV